MANIARYHRKGPPDTTHPNYRDLSKEARGKVRGLSAILRIADALDRGSSREIESVRAAIDRAASHVTLFLRAPTTASSRSGRWRSKASSVARRVRPRRGHRQGRGLVTSPAAPRGEPRAARVERRRSAPPSRPARRAACRIPRRRRAPSPTRRPGATATRSTRCSPRTRGRREGPTRSARWSRRSGASSPTRGARSGRPRRGSRRRRGLRYADGEEAALELRDGKYWVTAAGALPGGARTPEEALDQLRRVLARRSYAGLMRVLTPATRAAVEGDLRALVEGLERPGTLPVQVSGDGATVGVPGGHQVKLRREAGVWRVEDWD